MRPTRFSSLLCVCLWATSSQAFALSWSGKLPILRHNPSIGTLSFTNSITVDESHGFLPTITISSKSGKLLPFSGHPDLVAGPSYLTRDLSFNTVPVGKFDLGPVVNPGTPTSDLGITVLLGIVYDTPGEPDDQFYPPPRALLIAGEVVSVPEPGASFVALMSFLGLASLRRRK